MNNYNYSDVLPALQVITKFNEDEDLIDYTYINQVYFWCNKCNTIATQEVTRNSSRNNVAVALEYQHQSFTCLKCMSKELSSLSFFKRKSAERKVKIINI